MYIITFYILYNLYFHIVPTREMGPRELLKSSSPSFGRSGDWVVTCDSSRPPISPSALGLG